MFRQTLQTRAIPGSKPSLSPRPPCPLYSLCGGGSQGLAGLAAPRPVRTRLAQGRPASSPFPSPQRGGPSGAREHSVHFISDYRFLNIIKSLACSGGSVSQSVGSYFSTSLQKTKGSGAGQTDGQKGPGRWGEGERRRADTRGNTLSRTQRKVPEKRRASDAGREAPEKR